MATEFYTGIRNHEFSVGQKFELNLGQNWTIQTDFESFLDGFHDASFVPNKINFGVGVQYKQWGWTHYCLHDLDTLVPLKYPKKDRFYVVW